ncbi:MAG: N-acetylmuramoyl-L-alanine amidase [Candidatus Omnitrophica bacterium]|nr:N-acetylmuramoyl-L-alanine amidase [Candidatus Omnitrophota bacterium]
MGWEVVIIILSKFNGRAQERKLRGVYSFLAIFLISTVLSSCATSPTSVVSPVDPMLKPYLFPPIESLIPPLRHDVYHTVGPLETVWRIGKMYDVDVEKIIRKNRLNKKGQVKAGQSLLIPNAAPLRPVVPLYPSRKWRYIIIHHSATDSGNALAFDQAHSRKGWSGLGYHFVIDNGTAGKENGQIEVSPRWIKQQDGAHCKALNMNTMGIGICLVGDFTDTAISSKQMDSLVFLVNYLCRYYGIRKKNILRHGHVPEANTECPGKRFPWEQFKTKL